MTKICKQCKMIYEGNECPNCQSKETVDNSKGKLMILNSENSEIAKNLKITKKGSYAIKLG